MYTEKEGLAFVWQDTSNGARILRVYSGMPSVLSSAAIMLKA